MRSGFSPVVGAWCGRKFGHATMRFVFSAAAILLLAAPVDASNAKGAAYLQENRDAKGVTTLPSGLQYKVIQAATNMSSPTPSASTPCECHYEGKTIDGTVSDHHSEPGSRPSVDRLNRADPYSRTAGLRLVTQTREAHDVRAQPSD